MIENTTYAPMNYNKITLAFSGEDEHLFLKKYFSYSILQFRVSFILLTILYGGFGFLDSQIVPEHAPTFLAIRFLFVIPILLIVFILSFSQWFHKVWQPLLLICVIVGGFGISIMTMLAPENYTYYAGLMLVFSASYFFIKLRFFLATIAGWSILVLYNIGAIFFSHTPDVLLISNNFFFISANLIGMFAAYNIEYYARRNFFLSQKLDAERLLVIDVNKNLEATVEERTKELLKAKEKAEESDRLKSAFLANMSHEIRTPMNGIIGFAELLKEPGLTGEEQQNYIRIIEKSGVRMLNIINDIVDISKIEAGLMTIEIKESNLNEQINYVYTFLKPEAEEKGIKLSYNTPLPVSEAILKTDREKVYAILTNLVKNSIKYTNDGTIEIGCAVKNGFLEIFVQDTGVGIPDDRQNAIFERFIQADVPDEFTQQGAGLGLSITKAYVEMLGGKIWVDSKVGVGSTFYFTLPLNAVIKKETIVQQNVSLDIAKPVRKLKILLAEDDNISEMIIEKTLLMFSKKILKAKTGAEAVDVCQKNPDLDLVMMDIRMPDMGGYQATRKIRRFNKKVIIIAQTAHGLSGDREKAIEAGCNDYISKPINKSELFSMIQKYFGE